MLIPFIVKVSVLGYFFIHIKCTYVTPNYINVCNNLCNIVCILK